MLIKSICASDLSFQFFEIFLDSPPTPSYNVLITPQMKENTPSYSWSGKIGLTYPPDRCMNKISPFLRLINYIVGLPRLYDTLYTTEGPKWGNLCEKPEVVS